MELGRAGMVWRAEEEEEPRELKEEPREEVCRELELNLWLLTRVGGVTELKLEAVMELERLAEEGEKEPKLSMIRSSALEKLLDDPLLKPLLDPLPEEKLDPEEENPDPLLDEVNPEPLFELKLEPELPDLAENEGLPIKD